MSLIVETGSGLTNANSYISVADADTYVADHGNESVWTAATTAQKEAALRNATQYIDLQYGSKFKSSKTNIDSGSRQALQFPRIAVTDDDGYLYDDDEMPDCLKHATVEAALRILAGDDLLGVLDSATIQSESSSVGPLSESITYVGGKPAVKRYPKIYALLKPIINDTGNMMLRG